MNKTETLWVEKYRPKTINECVLPEEYKNVFREYVARKDIPHLLLNGSPGVGKTTVAKALCEEIGCDYLMINGSDESGIDTFRMKIKNYASSISLMSTKKVIIIDEGDYLNANSTQPALRSAMEDFAHNCTIIFTCNFKNKIIDAIQSRCAVIDFKIAKDEKVRLTAQFMKRCDEILRKEGVSFTPAVLAEVVKKNFPDFRKTLNALQLYSSNHSKTIDVGILASVSELAMSDLIKCLKEKDFGAMRTWVAERGVDSSEQLFRSIYDALYQTMEKSSIPAAVLLLAKYQYQAAFVADQEINTVALMTELMSECVFV